MDDNLQAYLKLEGRSYDNWGEFDTMDEALTFLRTEGKGWTMITLAGRYYVVHYLD